MPEPACVRPRRQGSAQNRMLSNDGWCEPDVSLTFLSGAPFERKTARRKRYSPARLSSDAESSQGESLRVSVPSLDAGLLPIRAENQLGELLVGGRVHDDCPIGCLTTGRIR